MIILDTNFIFALKSKKDKKHERAHAILDVTYKDNHELKLTTYSVVNETFTLAMARYQGNVDRLKPFYELFWGEENFFKILLIERNEYMKIYKILKKYCSQKRLLSFVDASLIYLYQKLDATGLISFDQHFDNILNRIY